MSKIAICACSNAGLDYLDYPKDISILRSVIHFKDLKVYNDYIDMDAKTFYEHLSADPDDIPKTAYVSTGTMLEIFEEKKKQGYTDILVITISSNLSGLYDAVKRLSIDNDLGINIHPYDSKTLAYAQAYMALTAHKLAAEGKSIDEIINQLDVIRDNDHILFTVDTLLYLIKNGRLSKLSGSIGSFLKIRPLLELSHEGTVETIEKIRTTKKAQQRMVEQYFEETKGKNIITFISHAHNEEAAQRIKDEILAVYPQREITIAYLTPVVGAHTGPKGIGLGYIVIPS